MRLRKHEITPYFFIAPGVLILTAVIFYPLVYVAYLSFHDAAFLRPNMPFCGIQNYVEAFSKRGFWNAAINTTIWVIGTVTLAFLLGLIAALALNRRVKGISILRLLILMPWVIPVVASGVTWRLFLMTPFGIVDYVVRQLGLVTGKQGLLASPPPAALLTVMMVNIWRYYPFIMLTLLAGLQGIPRDLYDAAEIDGAGVWQKFRHVTIAQLMPVIMIVLVVLTIWNINAFTVIYVLTEGGPVFTTELFTLHIFRESFMHFEFGIGSANSIMLFIIGLILCSIYLYIMKRREW